MDLGGKRRTSQEMSCKPTRPGKGVIPGKQLSRDDAMGHAVIHKSMLHKLNHDGDPNKELDWNKRDSWVLHHAEAEV